MQTAPSTTSQVPQQLDPSIVNLAKAISQTETHGQQDPYTAVGGSGEYGAYQYTPTTWAADSQAFLGQAVPLTQATPAQQDQVAYMKIESLGKQGYTPAQIASIWNSGKPNPTGNVGVNKDGVAYNTPQYVASVGKVYSQLQSGQQTTPQSTASTVTPSGGASQISSVGGADNASGIPSGGAPLLTGDYGSATQTAAAPATLPSGTQPLFHGDGGLLGGILDDVLNAVTGSEQTFGQAIGTIGSSAPGEANQINASEQASQEQLLQAIHAQTNPTMKAKMLSDYQKIWGGVAPTTAGDINPGFNLSKEQVIGSALGTALDVGAAGTFAPEAETGQLLTKAEQTAAATAKAAEAAKAAEGLSTAGKLGKLAVSTLGNAAEGSAIGYGYDVSHNMQSGQRGAAAFTPGFGTAIGAALPLAGGLLGGVKIIASPAAASIDNSILRPLAKQFAYGANPGRTVAELGITGNSLDDLVNNIVAGKAAVGSQLGDIASQLQAKAGGQTIDLSSALSPLDDAMNKAAADNNTGLLNRLQDTKTALTQNLVAAGSPEGQAFITKQSAALDAQIAAAKASGDAAAMQSLVQQKDELTNSPIVSTGPKDLQNSTFQDSVDTKRRVGSITKFTGNPSDDAAVNGALKQVYGKINSASQSLASGVDSDLGAQWEKANGQYADLQTAEISGRRTANMAQSHNLMSLTGKMAAGTAAVVGAIASGGAAIPAILAGASTAVVEKALESPAIQTRLAAWLADQTPGVLSNLYHSNAALRPILMNLIKWGANSTPQPSTTLGTQ